MRSWRPSSGARGCSSATESSCTAAVAPTCCAFATGCRRCSPELRMSRLAFHGVASRDLFGLVWVDGLTDGPGARPVDVDGDASGMCRRFDELEVQGGREILE